jgi:hypothetical protein
VALFVIFAIAGSSDGWAAQIARFVIFVLAAGSAVVAWAAAVAIASVHKVVWPLALTSAAVCVGTMAVVLRHALAR